MNRRDKRQKFQVGDFFEIELDEKRRALGQLIGIEKQALNSIACAFWVPVTGPYEAMLATQPISVLLVTPDMLRNGYWRIVGNAEVRVPLAQRPYEEFRNRNWVGAKISGSGNVSEFLGACLGLTPWDDWADPHYLASLLLPGTPVPAAARYKADVGSAAKGDA